MRRFWRDNGLSLTLLGAFLLFFIGQALAGWLDGNDERQGDGRPLLGLLEYVTSAGFVEATAENWESEFLQLFVYVVFTSFLYQRGSAESKDPDGGEEVDEDPRANRPDAAAPKPVHVGGAYLRMYEWSLSLAFFALFAVSAALHAAGGAADYNEERVAHGEAPLSVLGYVGSARFWFESLQNWQSEFLALFAMVVLSIRLRQRGSPESKPVAAPHGQTGKG